MISGQFAGPGGRVTVEGTIWIENYATSIVVEFLVDPSSTRTYVAAVDLGHAALPLDDVVQVVEPDSPPTLGVPVPAFIWFDGDGERYSFHVQAILTADRIKSRLGWDCPQALVDSDRPGERERALPATILGFHFSHAVSPSWRSVNIAATLHPIPHGQRPQVPMRSAPAAEG